MDADEKKGLRGKHGEDYRTKFCDCSCKILVFVRDSYIDNHKREIFMLKFLVTRKERRGCTIKD